jgi:hypothetical protein
MVEEEERALRSTRNDVLDVLDVCESSSEIRFKVLIIHQDKRFEIQQKTTFEEFLALMQNDRRTANIDREALSLIFERVSNIAHYRCPSSNSFSFTRRSPGVVRMTSTKLSASSVKPSITLDRSSSTLSLRFALMIVTRGLNRASKGPKSI